MSSFLSAHPRESGDPVLWALRPNRMVADSNPRHRASRKHWVPAFAGMSGLWLLVLIGLVWISLSGPALAQEPPAPPDQPLASPGQEARAQAMFEVVRCVVCQHESIADSPAGIAGDMRRLIREEIATGATDQAVRDDLVRRYGDYVLFTPPVRTGTWLLWFGPAGLAVLGGVALFAFARRKAVETAPLSADEERRLADLLQSETVRPDPDASAPHDGR
jgi:cytochrome c-type biogenesis protein CcmH